MKKCNKPYIGVTTFFTNVNIGDPVIANLEDITYFEILPYVLHFSEVLK